MSGHALALEEVERLGGYSTIYADPPWEYRRSKGNGAAENHYPTMPLAEIQALPVSRLAAKDALLFVWGTWPCLFECLATIEAWGFEFKTAAFVWIKKTKNGKQAFGGGNYTRANSEFCLLATRGRGTLLVRDRAVRQLIEEGGNLEGADTIETTIGRHSAKPEEARNRIVSIVGEDAPRIELFARERFEGWDVWGNEVDSDVILEAETTLELPETGAA